MRYQGSKKRIKKEIINIISKDMTEDKTYIELFGGGMNVIDGVDFPKKVAVDMNQYVISLWNQFKKKKTEFLPKDSKEFTKEMYDEIKDDWKNNGGRFPKYLIGYVGNCCSNGSSWFNGFAHYNKTKNEDHVKEAYNSVMKQLKEFKHLDTTDFVNTSYDKYKLPEPDACVIYLDPPYSGTKGYKNNAQFDNDKFWNFVRKKSKEGYKIYVSEYSAPSDFTCIWSKTVKDGMRNTANGEKQNEKVEKLFIYNQ